METLQRFVKTKKFTTSKRNNTGLAKSLNRIKQFELDTLKCQCEKPNSCCIKEKRVQSQKLNETVGTGLNLD